MPGNIKGIIVEIGGDTSKLQKALNKVNSTSNSLSKELKGVNSLLKFDPKSTELLNQKQELLSESIETTKDKLQQLQRIKEQADKKMANGDKISAENYRNLQREIVATQNKLNGLTDELKQFNTENSKITKASKKIEEYGNKISKASDKVNDLGNKASVVSGAVVAGGAALVNSAMSLEDAVAKYISSTNTATNETEKYKTVLENINKANYGDGYEDIANSMAAVKMQLKDINDADLENITEKAIALRDLFGYEVSESIRAVKALMDNFNITADESFNLIAEGKKQGLDFSNELLDNINEYSVQFKKIGLDAEDMFNIFKVGSENGAFNLDKIGDAVKEFSIRVIDGSNTTEDGFKRIGLNADEMAKKFANGGETAKQAFIEVVNRLGKMDDKVSQSVAGVDLFGSMWEDLGPTVITSFSKMDAGISKSSNSMQDSIDELYDTTKKKAETQLKRLQSLGAEFGEEMLPVLEKIIDKAEDFIDCLEDMSDEEKENLVKIALLAAGFGPLTKAVGTAGTGIGTLTKVIGGIIPKITQATTGTTGLASAFGSMGIAGAGAITFFGAVAVGLGAYLVKQHETIIEANKLTQETRNQKEAFQELMSTQNQKLSVDMQQIDRTQKLWKELQKITDSNGKVKKGYEDRAKVITSTLSEALGIEIGLNGDVIQGYKDIQKEIDGLIRKKKAEVIMAAQEEAYSEAIDKRTDAYIKLNDIQNQIDEKNQELATAKRSETAKLNKEIESLTTAYQEQKDLVQQYDSTIADYEYDQKLAATNTADSIEELVNRNAVSLQTDVNNLQQSGLDKLGLFTTQLQNYKDYRQQEIDAGNKANAQMYQDQIENTEKQLQLTAESFAKQITKVEDLTPEMVEVYGNIADYSTEAFNKAISVLPDDVQKELNEMVWITDSNTSLEDANLSLGQRAAKKFEEKYSSDDGKSASEDYIAGAKRGINASKGSFWEILFNVGNRGNRQFRAGLGDGSPSVLAEKAMSDYFAGANIGMKSSGKKFLKSMNKYGSDANNEFSSALHTEEIISKMQNGMFSNSKKNNLQTAFNRQAPANNNSICNNITFNIQELDKARLEQCFDYINKKFGLQY